MSKRTCDRSPVDAFRTYAHVAQALSEQLDLLGVPAWSLFPPPLDTRLLVVNGLIETGEVSAADIERWRGVAANHAVIRSGRFDDTVYVVFRSDSSWRPRTSTPGRLLPARARTALLARTPRVPRTTAATILSHTTTLWETQHPASRSVDVAAATNFVDLIELPTTELVVRLAELEIVPRSLASPINLAALRHHVDNYVVVTAGRRAVHLGAREPVANALLCSCTRFSRRGMCAHTVFSETLDLGVRPATRHDLSAP